MNRGDLFEQANQLWFVRGATNAALAEYRRATSRDPDDAVIAYQTARALWATGHAAEARAALARACSARETLDRAGQLLLRHWDRNLRAAPRWGPEDVADLDIERMAASASPGAWLSAARRALGHGIYGFAVVAFMRAGDRRDRGRELGEARSRRDVEWGSVRELRAKART